MRWMLVELGVDFALVSEIGASGRSGGDDTVVNRADAESILLIDGASCRGTAAILMLLAERHAGHGLSRDAGDPERPDYLQWMTALAGTLQPALQDRSLADAARARVEAFWEGLDAHFADGRRYLLGDRPSAADFLLTVLLRQSRAMPRPATLWINVALYASRMRMMPSLIAVHAREGLTDWIGDASFGLGDPGFDYQPTLTGARVILRPASWEDWTALYAIASDLLLWAGHPVPDRHEEPIFRRYFEDAMADRGGLVVIDRATDAVIGFSRFSSRHMMSMEVEIGSTFLKREAWGGGFNGEMKRLMLDHALAHFERVMFRVGPSNLRSQKALLKQGAHLTDRIQHGRGPHGALKNLCYAIDRAHRAG